MTYDELLATIVGSDAGDWNVIYCWGAGSGPSYHGHPPHMVEEARDEPMTSTEHGMTAAFRPDISITLAWGITSRDKFQTDWATGFPDKEASSNYWRFSGRTSTTATASSWSGPNLNGSSGGSRRSRRSTLDVT